MGSRVVRDALGIGVAVGAFGLSYGAVAVASGLSVLQTCALSLLMFTGASQFALVGVVAGGGGAVAAQFVIDESAAMGLARGTPGFWATGLAVFVCWNVATAAGAIGGTALSDPRSLGLDAAAPAAFLALLAPRLAGRGAAAV